MRSSFPCSAERAMPGPSRDWSVSVCQAAAALRAGALAAVQPRFIRLSMRSSTTAGSASVEVSPRAP